MGRCAILLEHEHIASQMSEHLDNKHRLPSLLSPQRSVQCIQILKCIKKRHAQEVTEASCVTCLTCAKKLFSKFPESAVDFIFFTDEKVFTVAPPLNLQNHRVFAPCGTKKRDFAADRLLSTRPTFSKSVWCLSLSQNLDALN